MLIYWLSSLQPVCNWFAANRLQTGLELVWNWFETGLKPANQTWTTLVCVTNRTSFKRFATGLQLVCNWFATGLPVGQTGANGFAPPPQTGLSMHTNQAQTVRKWFAPPQPRQAVQT
jgi:hypothetical protein